MHFEPALLIVMEVFVAAFVTIDTVVGLHRVESTVLEIVLSLVFILFVYRRYNKHNETSNTNNANNLTRPRQQNNLRNDRNTGVYEPISGQSYPRPVSNVTRNWY